MGFFFSGLGCRTSRRLSQFLFVYLFEVYRFLFIFCHLIERFFSCYLCVFFDSNPRGGTDEIIPAGRNTLELKILQYNRISRIPLRKIVILSYLQQQNNIVSIIVIFYPIVINIDHHHHHQQQQQQQQHSSSNRNKKYTPRRMDQTTVFFMRECR